MSTPLPTTDPGNDPAAKPIYPGQDFYVPAFEVTPPGQGSRLPDEVLHDVISVSYTDDITTIDSFQLTVNNWDARTRTFKYSDGSTFLPGKQLELWMGYRGKDPLRRLITGEITSLQPNFPSDGAPTLTVSALNVLHRFRKKQETFAYLNKTDSQIARQVAARLGVPVHTQPDNERPYPYLVQDNQYDIVFLMERARRIGYDLWVEEDQRTGKSTLHFEPSENLKPVTYQLTWGKSLVQFQPTLTTANQVGQVTVRAWNRSAGKMITVTAQRPPSQQDADVESSFNQREDITSVVVADEAEAKRVAADRLRDIAHEMVTGTGSTVGLPDLRAGRRMSIDGLGARFNGRYFVTGTTHTLDDSGYVTQFTCRRDD
ncbi:phage late control D family protein [Kitasatospora acidiphila]|uniref:phage late control D family protein n=1 Tax=Kitasatospora acidiphila TaxID=2567942 RepID=UPI003C7764A4